MTTELNQPKTRVPSNDVLAPDVEIEDAKKRSDAFLTRLLRNKQMDRYARTISLRELTYEI